MKKIEKSTELIEYLTDYLIRGLDELIDARAENNDYAEGEIAAFVECLEVLSLWNGFTRFAPNEIEKRYPVK